MCFYEFSSRPPVYPGPIQNHIYIYVLYYKLYATLYAVSITDASRVVWDVM